MTPTIQRTLLIVEDSDADFEALEWSVQAASIQNPLVRCRDAKEAIEFLSGRGELAQAPRAPLAFVLLDLNLPGMGGRELLRYIRSTEGLKTLPVVMFSSSANVKEIEACYNDGANSYIVKPLGLSNLCDVMEGLARYWFNLVALPAGTGRKPSWS